MGRWVSLWVLWVLAVVLAGVLCFPVAEALGLPVAWGMKTARAGNVLVWAASGAMLGLAQWLALRSYVPRLQWWLWVLASALGLAAGALLYWVISMAAASWGGLNVIGGGVVGGAAIISGTMGLGLGLCQWLVLQRYARASILWVLAHVAAGTAFLPIDMLIAKDLGRALYSTSSTNTGETVGDLLTWAGRVGVTASFVLAGVITGLTLIWLLRGQTSRAGSQRT